MSQQKNFVFDIEHAIANWKQFVSRTQSLDPEDLEELEDHLRAELDASQDSGMPDDERFREAVRRIGSLDGLEESYRQVVRDKRWTPSQWPARAAAGLDLIRSYSRTAWSSMIRHKGYAILNLSGLALALAACILILVHVSNELGFDRYHESADRIHRIEMLVPTDQHWGTAFVPIGPAIVEGIPGVESMVRVSGTEPRMIRVGDVHFVENRFTQSEPALFEMFDFEIVQGSVEGLARAHTVMLSESTANRYFGDQNPVGQSIEVGTRSSTAPVDFEVVGVYADMREDSHFVMDFVASFATTLSTLDSSTGWRRLAFTYVQFHPDMSQDEFESRLSSLWTDLVNSRTDYRSRMQPFVQPLTGIHLHSQLTSPDIQPQGSYAYILIFIGAALLLLIVACVNYINLTVARYSSRVREVGVRKVIGATRGQLITQFYGEAIGYTVGALMLAGLLMLVSVPYLESWFDLSWQWQHSLGTLAVFLVPAIVLVTLAAGSYPALFLSAFSPHSVLKGATPSGHRAVLRKGLLVFQFLITSTLIVATIVVHRQLEFTQDTRFGFEEDQILLLPTRGALPEGSGAMQAALADIPGVESVSAASGFPGHPLDIAGFRGEDIEDYDGDGLSMFVISVDTAYASTMGLDLAEGRLFDPDRPADRGRSLILNEAAVRAIGWQEPIGKRLGSDGQLEVIGVVRDFHTASMFEEIHPLFIELGESSSWIGMKVSTGDLRETIATVEVTWKTFIPDRPFEYSFLDDDFKAMYQQEVRLAGLFTGFSLLTIVIAMLGLIGLVAFDGRQRRKEIGIRKAMGASATDIVYMLSKRFVALIVLAFAVSIPLSAQLVSWWLERFAYRISISSTLFLVSGSAILLVALITVGIQAARSARVAPVECLRQD